MPRIRPSRGSHITLAHETLPLAAGAIVPAGGGRAIFALPWLGSTLVGTTDNEYDADDLDHVQPAEGDIGYLLGAVNAYFGAAIGPRARHGRLRRRATADLHRRPEEVGRHLAQGRALRDLERDDHHHGRQADDVAADGEDGRRSPGRARGAHRAVPHARGPAGPADRRRRPAAGGGRARGGLRAPGRPLRPCGPRGPRGGRRERRAGPADRARRARSTCWPRRSTRRAASRR